MYPNSLNSWETGIFEVPLLSYLTVCEDYLPGKVYVMSRGADNHYETIL